MASPLVLVPSPPNDLLLEACADAELDLLRLERAAAGGAAGELERHRDRVLAIANPGEGPCGADLIDALPRLEVISHFGVGYDTVDVPSAAARGVVVTNVAGSNDEEVADTALGLLLMTVRELGRAEQHLRAGHWRAGLSYPLTELSLTGATLGLLGIGAIGQAVARRARACGMEVVYHARNPRELPYRYYADLREMATDCDVLVVAAPGGAATRHLVDAEVMAALGPQGVLVNVARGSVVDEAALVTALREGRLGRAGLDVFADEPHVPAELLELPNVVALPHVGSASWPTRRRMAALAARNLRQWFTDRTVLTPVAETRHLLG